jgi:hypothetical protein
MLTTEMIEGICEVLKGGNFRIVAAQKYGISRHTMNQWIRVGKRQLQEFDEGKRPWPDVDTRGIFVQKMGIAESDFEQRAVGRIIDEGSPAEILKFLQLTRNRRYTMNQNAIEDPETGEVTKIDPKALFREKMALLDGSEEESSEE